MLRTDPAVALRRPGRPLPPSFGRRREPRAAAGSTLSSAASTAFAGLVTASVVDSSRVAAADECLVTRQEKAAPPAAKGEPQLLVLHIAAFTFRLVFLFNFTADAATRQHLAALLRHPTTERKALLESYAEYANMVCGAVNRGLGSEFKFTGMSTPFVLDSSCADYRSTLQPTEVQTFDIAINQAMRFSLQVCICVEAGVSLDVRNFVTESAPSGELELF
ncbi:MAG TPA: hypothetical protein VI279_02685 [Rhodocyclaceae bacterium]